MFSEPTGRGEASSEKTSGQAGEHAECIAKKKGLRKKVRKKRKKGGAPAINERVAGS